MSAPPLEQQTVGQLYGCAGLVQWRPREVPRRLRRYVRRAVAKEHMRNRPARAEYFTPRPLVKTIIHLPKPQPREVVQTRQQRVRQACTIEATTVT